MRADFLPFAIPEIGEEEIAEVIDSIRSGWLTTGSKAARFEKDFAAYLKIPYALAVNSATAGLHLALEAIGIGPGDEVITSPLHPIKGDLSIWGFKAEHFPNAVFAAAHVVNLPTDTKSPERVLDFIDRNSDLILDDSLTDVGP